MVLRGAAERYAQDLLSALWTIADMSENHGLVDYQEPDYGTPENPILDPSVTKTVSYVEVDAPLSVLIKQIASQGQYNAIRDALKTSHAITVVAVRGRNGQTLRLNRRRLDYLDDGTPIDLGNKMGPRATKSYSPHQHDISSLPKSPTEAEFRQQMLSQAQQPPQQQTWSVDKLSDASLAMIQDLGNQMASLLETLTQRLDLIETRLDEVAPIEEIDQAPTQEPEDHPVESVELVREKSTKELLLELMEPLEVEDNDG